MGFCVDSDFFYAKSKLGIWLSVLTYQCFLFQYKYNEKLKKISHTVRIALKSNRKSCKSAKNDTPNSIHIYVYDH